MTSPKIITALDGVVATTTSNHIPIGSFKRVALLFRRADDDTGVSAFTVTGGFATDGMESTDPTMTSYAMLIDNVANSNSQTNLTHTASHSITNENADVLVWLDPLCPVTHIQITVTETSNGTHSAYVIGWED